MAWITGHADDQPRIPRGPCDPVAGMHATFAFLVALAERGRSGRGHHVESTMVESALNVAAEQVVEWSAYGNLMRARRQPLTARGAAGSLSLRGRTARGGEVAGALGCHRRTVARAALGILGDPEWAMDSALETRAGRRAAHDAIDEHLRDWTRKRERSRARGRAARPRHSRIGGRGSVQAAADQSPASKARHYFETPEHPVVGAMPLPSLPFRYASIDRWLRTPAPTIGQHNERVLCGILGLSRDELRDLEAAGVIGTRPEGL